MKYCKFRGIFPDALAVNTKIAFKYVKRFRATRAILDRKRTRRHVLTGGKSDYILVARLET
jgi:hypothetical protein